MNQQSSVLNGHRVNDVGYRPPLPSTDPGQYPAIRLPEEGNDGYRALRDVVQEHTAWIGPLRQEMTRVIVGQKHLVDRLLIALLTNGHVLLEGRAWTCQDIVPQDTGQQRRPGVQAPAIHPGHAARGHRRYHDLQPAGRDISNQARSDIQQPDPGRRDQSGASKGPKRAPGGYARTPGDHRRTYLRLAQSLLSAGHTESIGTRRNVSAARGNRSTAS